MRLFVLKHKNKVPFSMPIGIDSCINGLYTGGKFKNVNITTEPMQHRTLLKEIDRFGYANRLNSSNFTVTTL